MENKPDNIEVSSQRSQDQKFNGTEEKFELLLGKALNNDQYRPTAKQVDKMIELQEKAMDYTHDERSRVLPQHRFDRIIDLILTIGVLVVFLVIFLVVIALKPEYTSIVLTGIVSFIGGYGIGNVKPLKKNSENSDTLD